MATPFRDATEARITLLEDENAELAAEVAELRAKLPENQDAFIKRLEEARNEAQRELAELRAKPIPTGEWPRGPLQLRDVPEKLRPWYVAAIAFGAGFFVIMMIALLVHDAGRPR